ncbi:hypothetical protein POM88_024430 [Heracleum sosnowskyi]|uniref:Uncharacterized protein n=1 Tax=Heracleum sosnowskyi TaxID=360622 RepID=A0AAD8MLF8_9APIA|nr:hypothetical protein POM88_024430 [Heracleum sosnowskyi]
MTPVGENLVMYETYLEFKASLYNYFILRFFQPLSKSSSLKVGSPREACEEGNHGGETGHHPQDPDSSSTQSQSTTDQSHQEVSAVEYNCSHDQYFSSDSAQGRSYSKHVEGQVKPVMVF